MSLRTLFLLEGVLYYLPDATVHEILQVLSAAPRGSSLVFDYVVSDVIAHPEQYYGASGYLDYVARKGEPVLFGIAPDAVASFLQPYGYTV
jgi:O-methyltransferase involved in polyketide biosynthesis